MRQPVKRGACAGAWGRRQPPQGHKPYLIGMFIASSSSSSKGRFAFSGFASCTGSPSNRCSQGFAGFCLTCGAGAASVGCGTSCTLSATGRPLHAAASAALLVAAVAQSYELSPFPPCADSSPRPPPRQGSGSATHWGQGEHLNLAHGALTTGPRLGSQKVFILESL